MSTKYLFTISLLLPLVAMSATAYAGETITSKSYWPSEARKSAQYRTVGSPGDIYAISTPFSTTAAIPRRPLSNAGSATSYIVVS